MHQGQIQEFEKEGAIISVLILQFLMVRILYLKALEPQFMLVPVSNTKPNVVFKSDC